MVSVQVVQIRDIMIEENGRYFGSVIHKWTTDHKNKYVITGPIQGDNNLDRRIGRVAQVRLKIGHHGSDNVLLRDCNDVLTQHTNQSFWIIPDEFTSYLDECFEEVYMDDCDEHEYTLGDGIDPKKGFIIYTQSQIDEKLIENRDKNLDEFLKSMEE